MTDPANPYCHVGGWVLYATRCGHPIAYGDTKFDCQLIWHDFDHGQMAGPSVDTEKHSDTRLATRTDLEALRRGDSCGLCSLDTTPVPDRPATGQRHGRPLGHSSTAANSWVSILCVVIT